MHYVYIVQCSDETLYTGYTSNIEKRIKAHNDGKGAKYTRARLPVHIVYQEKFTDKRQAMRREYAIKQLTRKQKINLIEEGENPYGSKS